MTGITRYTRTHNIRAGVIRIWRGEGHYCMAVNAFRAGDRVFAGRNVIFSWRHASRQRTVMTAAACPANIRMIKAAIRI